MQDAALIMDRMYLLAARMQEDAELIKDRTYHLRTYKQCFVGTDGAAWLVNNGGAATIDDAVALGKQMVSLGLLEHVSKKHDFEAKYLFYRFSDSANDDQKHGLRSRSGTRSSLRSSTSSVRSNDSNNSVDMLGDGSITILEGGDGQEYNLNIQELQELEQDSSRHCSPLVRYQMNKSGAFSEYSIGTRTRGTRYSNSCSCSGSGSGSGSSSRIRNENRHRRHRSGSGSGSPAAVAKISELQNEVRSLQQFDSLQEWGEGQRLGFQISPVRTEDTNTRPTLEERTDTSWEMLARDREDAQKKGWSWGFGKTKAVKTKVVKAKVVKGSQVITNTFDSSDGGGSSDGSSSGGGGSASAQTRKSGKGRKGREVPSSVRQLKRREKRMRKKREQARQERERKLKERQAREPSVQLDFGFELPKEDEPRDAAQSAVTGAVTGAVTSAVTSAVAGAEQAERGGAPYETATAIATATATATALGSSKGGGSDTAAPDGDETTLRRRSLLTTFYMKHDPAKLVELDLFLRLDWQRTNTVLRQRYGESAEDLHPAHARLLKKPSEGTKGGGRRHSRIWGFGGSKQPENEKEKEQAKESEKETRRSYRSSFSFKPGSFFTTSASIESPIVNDNSDEDDDEQDEQAPDAADVAANPPTGEDNSDSDSSAGGQPDLSFSIIAAAAQS